MERRGSTVLNAGVTRDPREAADPDDTAIGVEDRIRGCEPRSTPISVSRHVERAAIVGISRFDTPLSQTSLRTPQPAAEDEMWGSTRPTTCAPQDGTALADVGGIAVHIGARASALADPSEMLVSSTVKGLVAGSGWHLYRVAG